MFETAVDAVITGDLFTLERLLRENPGLVRERSEREHRATLLHYLSANGVEGFRQQSPPNAVDIARTLLDAGAEVDASIDVYSGNYTTLGLTATSTPPMEAGVQIPLLELLLARGAKVDGVEPKRNMVMDCLANGCPEAAQFLAGRGARLTFEGAAGVGRLDVVKELLDEHRDALQSAFFLACGYGHTHVAAFLLEQGADLRARNSYGGTALEQTLWFFINGSRRIDYLPVLELLLDAGSEIAPGALAWLERQERRTAAEKAPAADILRRHGAST